MSLLIGSKHLLSAKIKYKWISNFVHNMVPVVCIITTPHKPTYKNKYYTVCIIFKIYNYSFV